MPNGSGSMQSNCSGSHFGLQQQIASEKMLARARATFFLVRDIFGRLPSTAFLFSRFSTLSRMKGKPEHVHTSLMLAHALHDIPSVAATAAAVVVSLLCLSLFVVAAARN